MTTTTKPYLRDTITGVHRCNTWAAAVGDRDSRRECEHGFTHSPALAREGHTLTSAGERRC